MTPYLFIRVDLSFTFDVTMSQSRVKSRSTGGKEKGPQGRYDVAIVLVSINFSVPIHGYVVQADKVLPTNVKLTFSTTERYATSIPQLQSHRTKNQPVNALCSTVPQV